MATAALLIARRGIGPAFACRPRVGRLRRGGTLRSIGASAGRGDSRISWSSDSMRSSRAIDSSYWKASSGARRRPTRAAMRWRRNGLARSRALAVVRRAASSPSVV